MQKAHTNLHTYNTRDTHDIGHKKTNGADLKGAEIEALPGAEWQKVIYRTLNVYGAYYMDSMGGNYGVGWQTECAPILP